MLETMFPTIDPAAYMRELYSTTKDGEITVTRYSDTGEVITEVHKVDWTKDDAERLAGLYEHILSTLTKTGKLKREQCDRFAFRKAISVPEYRMWRILCLPLAEFDPKDPVIRELRDRGDGNLSRNEYELLKKHRNEWYEAECLKRLPLKRTPPFDFIYTAQIYELAVRSGDHIHENIIEQSARHLAEEMVLYYHKVA